MPADHFSMTATTPMSIIQHMHKFKVVSELLLQEMQRVQGEGGGRSGRGDSISTAQPGHSGLPTPANRSACPAPQYYLLPRDKDNRAQLAVGNVVLLPTETKPTSKPNVIAKLETLPIAKDTQNILQSDAEATANATIKIRNNGSVYVSKRAAQTRLLPTSFEVLGIWKSYAKRIFLPDLKFGTITVNIWEASEVDLANARATRVNVSMTTTQTHCHPN